MRLKEIKPGMVIHCKTDKEIKAISDAGFNGFLGKDITGYMVPECYVIIRERNTADWTNDFQTAADYGIIIEFSDLIIPEMTAEEVVPILTEICNRYNGNEDCEGCPLNGLEHICNGNECPFTFKDYKQIVEICAQWKYDHEKKEPEIEWVYRVFGAENYGEKFFQTEEEAIKRCEELAKSQKTKQYARYERVCRVEAVE